MNPQSDTTDQPLANEPHHTRCPAFNGRWCYRESCDSDLGCIEYRRGKSQTTVLVPIEPTEAMLHAGARAFLAPHIECSRTPIQIAQQIWAAMVAEASTGKESQQ